MIPASPGAARGTSATIFTSHFRKHIPGNPTVVPSFMPGAGGAVGMNYLYNVAPRDGTVIITPLTTAVLAQAIGEKSTKYDVTKMHWIGRNAINSQIVYVSHTTGVTESRASPKADHAWVFRRRQFANHSASHHERNAGHQVQGDPGVKGSAAFNLAVERGELDAALTTWATLRAASHLDWVESRKGPRDRTAGPYPASEELSNVPLASDLTTDADGKALLEFASSTAEFGQAFVAPPEVPAPIIAALRRAFDETINKDPEYIAAAKKAESKSAP